MRRLKRETVEIAWPTACGLIVGGMIGGITQSWSVGLLSGLIAGMCFRGSLAQPLVKSRQNIRYEALPDDAFRGYPYLWPRPNPEDPLETIEAHQQDDPDLNPGWGA